MTSLTKRERDQLVANHFEFARKMARIFAGKCTYPKLDRDECESAALKGLVRAGELFDPTRGHVFATYAGTAVRNCLRRYRKTELRRLRLVGDARRVAALVDNDEDPDQRDPLERASRIVGAVQDDHAPDVIERIDAERITSTLLRVNKDERYRRAITRRLAGEDFAQIARDEGVNPTTVMRWVQDARLNLPARISPK